ncbi:hypothetical protein [Streptomyces achromogenes]|uniref:hypothetical protein n=1 Tax=Streptomyces achromogenes TaxID=67255 RepID=UPI0004C7A6C1|nr:hypothetical protein [Streptomyces achromogenes]
MAVMTGGPDGPRQAPRRRPGQTRAAAGAAVPGGLLIFVRDLDELRILGRTAPNGTRIVVLPEQEPRTQ